MLLNTLTYVL